MADGAEDPAAVAPPAPSKKQQRGIVSRLWWWIFGGRSEDYEKRLQHLSNEEAAVHARMKRRAQSSRRMIRNLIVSSVILEVVAVVYAIMTTRSADLSWQIRAIRVLPMFVLPGLSSVIYSTLMPMNTQLIDRKDQKTLDKLRAERKAKIDELKERTNFYNTQQLIQKYDLDPAAKAAAATILASKLGADSGLKVYVGDEPNTCAPLVKSSDAKPIQTTGLRNRKQSLARSSGAVISQSVSETPNELEVGAQEIPSQAQKAVEHYKGSGSGGGGWIARIASLLVGEDPSQCYALVCGNCHMHNGLARKEDFPHITYYCPHCHALNTSRQSGEHDSGSRSGKGNSSEVTNDLPKVPEQPVGQGDAKENTSEATS
ncbi:putative integral membrane metal-binding protein (DUF2296) [Musa troglodytarum]|uniref:Integral membrane metal-binding protein (DUF2296) n=1 Tax=Musa troglodytarum TaxID=320322 RepID=A0A9E7JJY7_9LILI|nr:putative integral membrane metal-binding protein (DUF2296) [Musa troglodytarum]